MNDFEGLLATDFVFKPPGKSAPMAASKATSASALNFDLESGDTARSTRTSNSFSGSFVTDQDPVFSSKGPQKPQNLDGFSDLFGGSARYNSKSESLGSETSFNFDSMYRGSDKLGPESTNSAIYDKPVYDDDIFDGLPGLNSSASVKHKNVFSSMGSAPNGSDDFDDLLGGFGKAEHESKTSGTNGSGSVHNTVSDFDDLIPGFGGSSPPSERPTSEASRPSEPTVDVTTTASSAMENPFGVLESSSGVSSSGQFTNPFEETSKLSNSGSTKFDGSVASGGYDEMDPFDGLGKSVPLFSSKRNNTGKEKSPSRTDPGIGGARSSTSDEPIRRSSMRSPERHSQRKMTVDNGQESHQILFTPTVSADIHESVGQIGSPPSYINDTSKEANSHVDACPKSEEYLDSSGDVWLIVSDIPLYTQPTSAPPPSRPPPPKPARKKANDFSSFQSSFKSVPTAEKTSVASPIDELEDFVMGRSQNTVDEHANGLSSEEPEMNSVAAASAAAMKEAMERAEAKFKYAKGVREREYTKASRNKEAVQLEKDEKAMQDAQERAIRERQEMLDCEQLQMEQEGEEREQRRLEKESKRDRETEKEKEEKEREQRRIEKERERAREIEREREKARHAVERATREARGRAAVEARERAVTEARLKAERAAVQRAQAEARGRAAAGAKERAEKAAAEARERANSEAREREARERAAVARAEAEARRRAQRSAVERATAEARERAAAEARERAAAEARERAAAAAGVNQQKNENDLETFFSMGRASSAPRPRANSLDPMFDNQSPNRQEPKVAKSSARTSSSMRKASSTTNTDEDLSSIFGAAPSTREFQEVEGESEERRRAKLERHQRTQERAAKALAEMNQRDLQTQRDQAERHSIAETLDAEIKRWAAGKEGNLRALLSTLQYVLWPECGWQPVSLTDLITAASVKKVYRKATLCIHPDKVQQKGANLQQKYIAEKVFDLLKEAWNKLNSEELF